MDGSLLSLRAALAADRLEGFVRQEQARGVELGRGSEFERALALFLVQRRLRQGQFHKNAQGFSGRDEEGR
jgi:hypothetical protein